MTTPLVPRMPRTLAAVLVSGAVLVGGAALAPAASAATKVTPTLGTAVSATVGVRTPVVTVKVGATAGHLRVVTDGHLRALTDGHLR